ncbi:MAG: hypothetical protein AB7R40_23190 [Nitrospiraceae bacterium]
MITIRVLHSKAVLDSLCDVICAADLASNAPLYVTARTVLARVKQAKYLTDVDVTLSDEAAERLRALSGIHEDIFNALDAALGQKEASEERRPERRDRKTVRESRGFHFLV